KASLLRAKCVGIPAKRSRARRVCCTFAMLILGSGIALVPVQAARAEDQHVQKLIGSLGSKDETEHTKAEKALRTLGEAALEALQKLADSSNDFDTRLRADRLVESIINSLEL